MRESFKMNKFFSDPSLLRTT